MDTDAHIVWIYLCLSWELVSKMWFELIQPLQICTFVKKRISL